ncbi:MAG: tRNA lysidine(34) synthetase TilS [Pseudomonadota bacterium]
MSGTDGVTPEKPEPGASARGDPVAGAFSASDSLLASAKRVFVGFSGGVDSAVLLASAAERLGGKLIALHANHALHDDAGLWQQHCEAVCAELGVPLRSIALELRRGGQGVEAAARKARYAWFTEQLANAGDVLLLAHHRDDQAETLLLRLLRGAGPDGLGGMPASRRLGAGTLLRPFLDLPRAVLMDEARRRKLPWVEDPSNNDPRFDRNYLRHRVMPLLAERWPSSSATMARAATLLREESAARAALAPELVFSVVGDPGFSRDALTGDPAGAALQLRAWLRLARVEPPPAARLREFLRQCREGRGAELVVGDRALTRFRDHLFLHPRLSPDPGMALQPEPQMPLKIDGAGQITLFHKPSARAAPLPELEVRLRRGGERLAGDDGRHHDLKKLCQDFGIPPWWRSRMPLLFELKPSGPELLAAAAMATSPRCRELGLELRWSPPVESVVQADTAYDERGVD